MRSLSFELKRIKETQLSSLYDLCTIDTFSDSTVDSYGSINKIWSSSSPISCGYEANPGSKTWGETTIKQNYKALFRIPDNTAIKDTDKITLTALSGSSVDPIQYQITSIERGKGLFLVGCSGLEV
jgi:hypothetical protein